MGERPVSDVADALRGLRSVVNDEVDRAVELIQGEATALSAALRAGGRSQHLAHVAAEIEQVSQQLPSVLADIPAEVGTVVDTAIADLDRLLRPPGESTAAGASPLAAVPVFERRDPPEAPSAAGQHPLIEFATEAEFKVAAENPEPNTRYRYRDVEWTTDELGRTISVIGKPSLTRATRDKRLQAQIGREGRPTDVGFHLLGHALGGPTNRINVVSGNGVRIDDGLANLNQGAYAKFEKEIRKQLAAGRDVRVEIRVVYGPRNSTTRPDEFVARLTVDGDRSRPYRFVNK